MQFEANVGLKERVLVIFVIMGCNLIDQRMHSSSEKKLSIKLHDTKSWNPSICKKKNSDLTICAVIFKRKHCFVENKVLSQNMK